MRFSIVVLIASLAAPLQTSDAAVYEAVIRSFHDQLRPIPRIRVFVLRNTLVITAAHVTKLARDAEPGELQMFDRIRTHPAYKNMLVRSKTGKAVPPVKRATLASVPPRNLRCEGVNWELSRDVVVRLGTPGYSRDGTEAVVVATFRECISRGTDVILMKKAGGSWRIESEACLACVGE